MKKALFILTLGLGLFVSCKKEDSDSSGSNQTATQKIQQKWNLVNVLDINYAGTTTTIDYVDTVLVGNAGDYLDFRTDNKVYIYADGSYDTLSYSIVSDTKINFDGELFDISKLTNNEFSMIFSDRTGSTYYDNIINMKR